LTKKLDLFQLTVRASCWLVQSHSTTSYYYTTTSCITLWFICHINWRLDDLQLPSQASCIWEIFSRIDATSCYGI